MNIALFSLLIFIILLLIIVPIIFDIFRGLNKRNMRVHLINIKQEIRKFWNNRPAQNEGPMIFVYSLPFIIVGGLLTLGEMHLWNSMIVFIPGIFLFSVITIIGAILMVAGFLTMIFGKQ